VDTYQYHLKPSSFASVTGITPGAGDYASYLHAKFYHMHARSNAVANLRCQNNQQNRYIARLIVRLDGKLSSLGRAHPIFCSVLLPGGAPQKSGRHIKIFRPCHSTFKLLLAPQYLMTHRSWCRSSNGRNAVALQSNGSRIVVVTTFNQHFSCDHCRGT